MNNDEIFVWCHECGLVHFPKYAKLLNCLEHCPDNQQAKEALERAILKVRNERAAGDVLSPHPDSTCGISRGDTSLAFELKTNAPVRFNFARLPGQENTTVMSIINALQDMGKSTTGMTIARGIIRLPGAHVWVIDPNGLLHTLLGDDADKFTVLRPGLDFRVNFSAPTYLPPGTPDAEYLAEALNFTYESNDLLAQHYERHDSLFLGNKVVEHYIRLGAKNWQNGNRPLPSCSTMVEALNTPLPVELGMLARSHKSKEHAQSFHSVLEHVNRRTNGLFDASVSDALPQLLSKNLILDVSRFGATEIAYFLIWLIAYLQRFAQQQGWLIDSRLRLFILLDDLQRLLLQQTKSPLPLLLPVLRQRGIHLCSTIHNFSCISSIAQGNVDLVCHVGPLNDNNDRRAFLDWAEMRANDDAVRKYFGAIPKGQGIIRHIKHPYSRPIAVRYHLLQKRDVPDNVIQQARAHTLADIHFEKPLSVAEILFAAVNTPITSTAAGAPLLDDTERLRRFLESIAAPRGWTKPQREHLTNAGVGNSRDLRERLLRQSLGFVNRHDDVNNGRGSGITLYELTAAGWQFLGRQPEVIPGKGSLGHKYYQEHSAETFIAALPTFLQPRLEYKIGRHSYDLMLASRDGRLIGIEIAASAQDRNEADNAIAGFLPHIDRIHRHVILAATEEAFDRVRRDISAAALLTPIRSRISVERIGEVWSKPAEFVAKWLS
jgi:hypothetical protein